MTMSSLSFHSGWRAKISSPAACLRTVPVTWWPAAMRALMMWPATYELAPVRSVEGMLVIEFRG